MDFALTRALSARSISQARFLRVICAIHSPDCVCIVESWLSNDILNSELCVCGYDVVRLDRNRHGGGVLLYINSVSPIALCFLVLRN
jgi:hypothetical protein